MGYRDFKMDANDDLAVENSDFAAIGGADAIGQACKIRLRLMLGEYWLDDEAGVDYLGQILIKNPDQTVVKELLRDALMGVPDVTGVIAADLAIDNATRQATISFTVSTSYSDARVSGQVLLA